MPRERSSGRAEGASSPCRPKGAHGEEGKEKKGKRRKRKGGKLTAKTF